MKRSLAQVAAIVALAVGMPTAAYAVNVSANYGSGLQYVIKDYGNGFMVSGNLKSTYGKPVYYQGRVVFNKIACFGSGAKKYGPIVRSKSAVRASGTVTKITTASCAAGGSKVQSRILEDRGLLPDAVGPWSAKY